MGRISSAPWLLSLSLMWLGWGAATTTAGLVLLFAGTTWAVLLLLQERTPGAVAWFTGIWTLGWVPAFAWQPWLLLLPAGLMGLAWYRRWHCRCRLRAALDAFHRLNAADAADAGDAGSGDAGSGGDASPGGDTTRREPGDVSE